ncbi:MAG TPA: hypothetical protein VNB22_09325 [Pyrinomonadaceae bacterium]|nr:hypothetical protein [Pyrinomonadaceae bacterium]
MRKETSEEPRESTKMFALTMLLMKFLLLAIAAGAFWLVQLILRQDSQLNLFTRGFDLL